MPFSKTILTRQICLFNNLKKNGIMKLQLGTKIACGIPMLVFINFHILQFESLIDFADKK